MLLIYRFILLAALSSLAGCGRQEPEAIPATGTESLPAPQVLEVEIQYADRYWSHSRGVGPNGEQTTIKNRFSGRANRAVLKRLEKIILHGPRVSTYSHSLEKEGQSVISRRAYGGYVPQWICCRLSDGRDIRVDVWTYGSSEGPWHVNGENGFRLALPNDEAREILDRSGWDVSGTQNGNTGVAPETWSLLDFPLSHGGFVLESNLSYENDSGPTSIESAACYVFNAEVTSENGRRKDRNKYFLGKATDKNLARLEVAILGGRASTLRYMPSGEVNHWNQNEAPIATIECKMNNGQEILIFCFASDNRLCVIGEEDFCLDLSETQSREILDSSGWERPK